MCRLTQRLRKRAVSGQKLATIFFNNILLAILKLGFLALVPLLDGAKETADTGVNFGFRCTLG
jgi:hypothetical protein